MCIDVGLWRKISLGLLIYGCVPLYLNVEKADLNLRIKTISNF